MKYEVGTEFRIYIKSTKATYHMKISKVVGDRCYMDYYIVDPIISRNVNTKECVYREMEIDGYLSDGRWKMVPIPNPLPDELFEI